MTAASPSRPAPVSDVEAFAGSRRASSRAARRLLRQPVTIASAVVLAAIFAFGAFVPRLAPQGWNSIDLSARWRNHPPVLSGWHLFGTDNIGRDVLVRTLYALHASEQTALLAALFATVLGVAIGGAAGYAGGWSDAVLMRAADLIGTFPALMLLLAAYVFLQPVTVARATLVFALYLWIPVARIVRANVASLRESEFVQAARSLGASDLRILVRHLLPNATGTIVVAATSLLGQVIMLEATVEFFGLGVSSQIQPTLGNLIGDVTQGGIGPFSPIGLGWWTWTCPAALLVVVLVCANLLGDGVDAALRPASRR
jgi:ABC-type dipeptide/oligopeptide/nickel transport system permease subunit